MIFSSLLWDQEVAGSNPVAPTILERGAAMPPPCRIPAFATYWRRPGRPLRRVARPRAPSYPPQAPGPIPLDGTTPRISPDTSFAGSTPPHPVPANAPQGSPCLTLRGAWGVLFDQSAQRPRKRRPSTRGTPVVRVHKLRLGEPRGSALVARRTGGVRARCLV